jgi:monovalent cation/proton antiporter MnhG/PhaG subunit
MGTALAVIATVFVATGLALATVALYGMLRMPDLLRRMHVAGLVTGPAVIAVLLGAVASARASVITSAVLVIVFVLITAPLSTHAIARAARRRAGGPDGDQAPLPEAHS